jgi:hypothetical protein
MSVIPKSGNRFPACAKPLDRTILQINASAGEGRSGKITLARKESFHA